MSKSLSNSPKSSQSEIVRHQVEFSGPLPPPSVLNKYDPEARKVIVDMADRQSRHRHMIERAVVLNGVRNERDGMLISATLIMFMMILGTILLLNDKPTTGFLTLFAPAVLAAGNFMYQKYREVQRQKKENDE